MITLAEYERRHELIVSAVRDGFFTAGEASAALAELTAQPIDHHAPAHAAQRAKRGQLHVGQK